MRRSSLRRLGAEVWLLVWLQVLACAGALASGPRYVTGPPFFPGPQAVPVGWKQANLLYSTDPGNLSAAVPHAAADALVAAAAGVWNLPVASITVGLGKPLAEHVSGANVYLDTSGMVYPADVMSSNAAAVPIAVIYDSDGSVTDTLLGAGASGPTSCNSNAVTATVDSFDPAGYILHAIIILNGRCTGAAAAQQLQMQYKLERAFGRVLGLAWSQANDNVFTGSPTPTYNQALHWPIMHPIDILCGQYSYQCLPNPFTLRPDDIASMVLVYPLGPNATVPQGKQVSLASANGLAGSITFPDGQGMAGVNVLAQREELNLPKDAWDEVSAVTGSEFRLAATSPFVAPGTSALASMGTVSQKYVGNYTMPYIPLDAGYTFSNLSVFTEPVNPLYTRAYGLGPYGPNAVAPSGAAPAPLTYAGVPAGYVIGLDFAVADAASSCGTGLDGVAADPAQMPATGWWQANLCGYGHASYFGVDVKAGHTFTMEATALDGNGLATTTKAMPVLGLFAPGDPIGQPGSLPSLGVAATAFQGLAYATTVLSGSTGQVTHMTIGVADQRGDGRPDFVYQGRLFYADNVEPAQVLDSGGTVTITGMGFRNGNTLLVNGVAATVTQWSASTMVATLPTMTAAHASHGVAVDVEVLDRGTGATSTIPGGLSYSGAAKLPNAMILLSAPAGTLPVGIAAAVPLSVRVVMADGVTPVAGDRITFSANAGSISFGCGPSPCSVLTDAGGIATTSVTPFAEGAITLQAADGTLLQKAMFTAQNPPNTMAVLRAPVGSFPVGTSITTPFVVRVYGPDGHSGLPNQRITFTVAGGSAVYTECNTPVCTATTDITGAYSIYVTPTGAGTVTLQAADGSLTQQASFTATQNVDTMVVLSAPSPTGYVGQSVGAFQIQLLRGDGVTGDYGEAVSFSVSPGATLSGCAGGSCQLYSNAGGVVGGNVSAATVGTFTLTARYGTLSQSVTFSTTMRSISFKTLSVPAGKVPIGATATAPFTAQLLSPDGVTPMGGYPVVMSGPAGQVLLQACRSSTCFLVTDGNGMVSTFVTPMVVGTIPISVIYAPITASTTVTGVAPADVLNVVLQPGGATLHQGDAVSLQVQLLQPDGATPDADKNVTYNVTNGGFTFAGCGAGPCTMVTDAQGLASISGITGAAGPVVITANYGSVAATISFTISARPNVLQVVSSPASGAFTGVAAALPFAVRVYLADGTTPIPGEHISLTVVSGSASLAGCGGQASCSLLADASGLVSTLVTPQAAGNITLQASDGNVTQTVAFMAISRPDVLKLVSVPAQNSYVGVAAAAPFALQVLLGNGASAGAGKYVTVSVASGSATLGACGAAASCALATDANGFISSTVTALAAGNVSLIAAEGGVSLTASFTAIDRPDLLRLVSAPSDGAYVGTVAGNPFALQVLQGDGVTPAAGIKVTVSVTNGSALLGACSGAATCVLLADAQGMVTTAVTPLAGGAITLLAADGAVTQSATFMAAVRPDVLVLVSAPANGALVGDVAATAFAVRVFGGDGVTPVAGRAIILSVAGGGASLQACAAATCTLFSDAMGLVTSAVEPLAAGAITLQAADGSIVQTATFTAASKPDVLTLVSVPADGSWVGSQAGTAFTARVTKADGVTRSSGVRVVLSVTNGLLAACGAASCGLVTDANGLVSTAVMPVAAGLVTLTATDGALTQTASFTAVNRPDTLAVQSVPANGSAAGSLAAQAFTVRVLAGDGSAGAGRSVAVTVTNGLLAACGAAACTLVSDASGLVSTGVTPLRAGTVGLSASEGAIAVSASFTAGAGPDVLTLTSVPADGALAGLAAALPFAVKAAAYDGSVAVGRSVTVSVTNGVLGACGVASCGLVTDANGLVSTAVMPVAAGLVTLTATDGALTQTASFTAVNRPDTLAVESVPANGSAAGSVATQAFSVRVLAGDGSAGVERSVTVTVTNGLLAPCGSAACTLVADANGLVSTGVTPVRAGTVSLRASEGAIAVSASFTAGAGPDVLTLTSVPADGVLAGDAAALPFALRVVAYDGSVAVGHSVTVTVTNGMLSACGVASCVLKTDANGMVTTGVTPLAAGVVNLTANDDGVTLASSFMAKAKPDSLVLVSEPSGTGLVGDVMPAAFTVRVLEGDGVTPAAGQAVVFSVTAGQASFSACGASVCTVVSDVNGLASSALTPLAPGTVTIEATGAGNVLTDTIAAASKPDLLQVSQTPGTSVHTGAVAATPFAVKVLLADGSTAAVGVSVTFSVAGRGAGAVQFGSCGGGSCVVRTDAAGMASTTITGVTAGTLTLVATGDAASGAGSVTWNFEVVANDDSLNAVEATTYVAEGSVVETTFAVSAVSNGAPAAALPVLWKGAPGVVFAQAQGSTDAGGRATAEVTLGPLAGGAGASAQVCGWTAVCAAFQVLGVAATELQIGIVSGGRQAATGGAALAPVVAQVSDGAGHPVAGAAVTVYQSATALTLDCPTQGRCPAQPVLGSKVTVVTTAADGTVSVSPLVVPGFATETSLAFATGPAGFATATVTNRP